MEYGGGGADDVHGQVEVTNPHRQVPLTPVHLPLVNGNSSKKWQHYQWRKTSETSEQSELSEHNIPSEKNVPCEPDKTNETLNKF